MGFLNSLIVRIKGDNKDLKATIADSNKSVNTFGSTVKKLGGLIAGAFSVAAIGGFIKESFNLANQVEGVRAAFERINQPGLLDNLKRATKGTVSELELMKRAVMARNFQLPLEELGSLLGFATKRAQETGQSVDYLVESIVLGIGRKSPLILDNLGISAVRLRQELKGVGVEMTTVADVMAAVAKIAADEMRRSGDVIDTTAIKIQQLTASWNDLKVKVGEFISNSETVEKHLGIWRTTLTLLNDDTLTKWQKFTKLLSFKPGQYMEDVRSMGDMFKDWKLEDILTMMDSLEGKTDAYSLKLMSLLRIEEERQAIAKREKKTIADNARTLETITKEISLYQDILKQTNVTKTETIKQIYAEIRALEEEKKAIEDLGIVRAESRSIKAPVAGVPFNTVSQPAKLKNEHLFSMAMGDLDPAGWVYKMVTKRMAEAGTLSGEAYAEALNKYLSDAFAQEQEWQGTLQSAFFMVSQTIADGVGRIFEGIGSGNIQLALQDVLGSIGDFVVQIGKLLVAYGTAMLALAMVKPGDPISAGLAIGAGLAAIAIGSMIKGAVSRGPSLTGGGGGGYGGGSYSKGLNPIGMQTITVEGILKGSDILISNRRTAIKQGGQT